MKNIWWHCIAVSFLFLLALAVIPGRANAMDDGGGRSVFAYGAGNRALALGGAFAAIADDASAALWNPGGLGLVRRREVQASHTNLFGLDFSEQYAAFVLPDWRWGTASVTFRKFGTSGIDERDSRNVVLGDDLTDSETEIALAYGRKLGAAWSVGGAVKMQRQSLAGYSDSGLGLDLGMQVLPLLAAGVQTPLASSLRLGVAVRNAIEPSIRLDEDVVPDPTAMRLGMAYERPLGPSGSILTAIDFEKTQDMDSRFHAGVEVRLVPYLVLRGGLKDGTLAAGTGVSWHDAGIDYMFEDHELGSVHRIGFSLAFGPTVEQSRVAYLEAEEAQLQSRLAAAFEEQNQKQIGDFMVEAKRALAEKKYEQALEAVAMIEVLDPENLQARVLKITALREQGLALERSGDLSAAAVTFQQVLSVAPEDRTAQQSLARVRAESDRRAARSAEIRQLLDQALDDFAANELANARDGFQRILAVDPEDQDAMAMLRRTEEAIHNRAVNLLAQSRALIQAGRFSEASKTLDLVDQLDPQALGLAEARSLLADRQLKQTMAERRRQQQRNQQRQALIAGRPQEGTASATTASTAGVPLTAEQQQELGDLYRRGVRAREAGRVDDAIRYWEFVWSTDSDYQRVAEYLKHEYLTRGMESFAAGQLNEAVSDWEKALQVDPDDDRARGYLERANQQLMRVQKILGGAH